MVYFTWFLIWESIGLNIIKDKCSHSFQIALHHKVHTVLTVLHFVHKVWTACISVLIKVAKMHLKPGHPLINATRTWCHLSTQSITWMQKSIIQSRKHLPIYNCKCQPLNSMLFFLSRFLLPLLPFPKIWGYFYKTKCLVHKTQL